MDDDDDECGAFRGLVGETEVLGEILPQSRFAHHKSNMTWFGLEPVLVRSEAGD
jgi:hypothetical protein